MRDDASNVYPKGSRNLLSLTVKHQSFGFVVRGGPPGAQVEVLFRAALTSDAPDFYRYIEKIQDLLRPPGVFVNWNSVFQFLAVLHEDLSVDLHLNEFPVAIQARVRRGIEAGEAVGEDDLADISQLTFPDVPIAPTDRVIYCFKSGWKFGLFFDLTPGTPLDADAMAVTLASLYKRLRYDYVYKLHQGGPHFDQMLTDGWFPFIELLGTRYRTLIHAYGRSPKNTQDIDKVIAGFDESLCGRLKERWWTHPVLAEKRVLLEAGVSAFLKQNTEGDIHCIKTLLPEIEGALRILYLKDTGRGEKVTTNDLIAHIIAKGRAKSAAPDSLLLTEPFLHYLKGMFFANFNLESGQVPLSRHSSGHGAASPEAYTRAKALQAILILDQLAFYL